MIRMINSFKPLPENHCGRYHGNLASDGHNQMKVRGLNLALGRGFRCFSIVLLSPRSFLLVFQNTILSHEVGNSLPSNLLGEIKVN